MAHEKLKTAIVHFLKDEWPQDFYDSQKERREEILSDAVPRLLSKADAPVPPGMIEKYISLITESPDTPQGKLARKYLVGLSDYDTKEIAEELQYLDEMPKLDYINKHFFDSKELRPSTKLFIQWNNSLLIFEYKSEKDLYPRSSDGNLLPEVDREVKIPITDISAYSDLTVDCKIDVEGSLPEHLKANVETATIKMDKWKDTDDTNTVLKEQMLKNYETALNNQDIDMNYTITFDGGKIEFETRSSKGTLTLRKYTPSVEEILDKTLS